MRILYFTDLHGNVKAFNHMTAKGHPARAAEFNDTFKWLKQVAEKHSCTRAVFGGDLFDSVHDLKMPYFNMMHSGMWHLDLTTNIIDGNHDKYDAIYKAVEPFKTFAQVHSVPESFYDPNSKMNLVFIPFQRSVEEAEKYVKTLTKEKVPTLVFIHQGIKGYVIDEFAIDKKVFDKDHIVRVFGGHYHFKIETAASRGGPTKIIYPGSVVSLHFDDSFSSKYAIVYDTDTDEVIWEENPCTSFFIAMTQENILEVMDKLEELAPVSFIRIQKVSKNEELRIPISFLLKFKGYDVSDRKIDGEAKFKKDGGNGEGDFDYAAYLKDMSKVGHGQMSYDLSHEQYKGLVLQGNDDDALVEKATQTKLDEVLQATYLIGKG